LLLNLDSSVVSFFCHRRLENQEHLDGIKKVNNTSDLRVEKIQQLKNVSWCSVDGNRRGDCILTQPALLSYAKSAGGSDEYPPVCSPPVGLSGDSGLLPFPKDEE